jgi:hypothetical protein
MLFKYSKRSLMFWMLRDFTAVDKCPHTYNSGLLCIYYSSSIILLILMELLHERMKIKYYINGSIVHDDDSICL